MNDIKFNRGVGGLGRPLAGEDHICGMIAVIEPSDTLPTGFNDIADIKTINSLEDAEALGITNDAALNQIKYLHYQLKTLYQINKKAIVYVGIASGDSSHGVDFSCIVNMQNFADGKIRQIGFANDFLEFLTSDLTAIQSKCDALEAAHKPVSVVYAANTSLITDIDDLEDLRALNNKNVSFVIGADGGGYGANMSNTVGVSASALGAVIGTLSLSKVNENIGWVGQFDISKNDTAEFDVPALARIGGVNVLVKTLSEAAIESLNAKGYIFLVKHIGTSGSYFNDSHTAISETSDYAYIENNRTIDKAVRNCRTYLLPSLNAPLYVNPDGTLTEDTILSFRNNTARALEEMQRNGEISAFEVTINPAQNVLSTSRIAITVKVVPVGVARNIEVNIGFAVKVG